MTGVPRTERVASVHHRPYGRIGLGVASAIAVTVVSWAAVNRPDVPAAEQWAFRAVNDAPSWLWPLLWLVMQLGNLAAPAAVAAAAAIALRRWRPAAAPLLAGYGAWALATAVKHLAMRARPDVLLPGVTMREGVEGMGFVSGHAAIATAIATVMWPYVSGRARAIVLLAVVGVCTGRVYAGAHLPLDVVGGAAIGALVGLATNALLGLPSRSAGDAIDPDLNAAAPRPRRAGGGHGP